jgi:uncharacterized protein YjbI with pentapeptide repeats
MYYCVHDVVVLCEQTVANPDHLAKLTEGVANWNAWRQENREVHVDLSGANLEGAKLNRTEFNNANLRFTSLYNVKNLREAHLSKALAPRERPCPTPGAMIDAASSARVDLSGTDLKGTDFGRTKLHGANLSGADLRDADFWRANLTHRSEWGKSHAGPFRRCSSRAHES